MSALFLGYRFARLKQHYTLVSNYNLGSDREYSDQDICDYFNALISPDAVPASSLSEALPRRDITNEFADLHGQYLCLEGDTSLWIDSLFDKAPSEKTDYQTRQAFAQKLLAAEGRMQTDRQTAEQKMRAPSSSDKVSERSDSRTKTPPLFRLRYFFAGTSALLPSRSFLLLLATALSLTLMLMSLAVMAQAGVLLGGTWLLGGTLTSACLWLAAHLSIASLGLPGLIALAVVGGWLAATFIVDWKFPGTISNVFFGLDCNGSTANSSVYYQGANNPDFIGKSTPTFDKKRAQFNPFMYLGILFYILRDVVFWLLNYLSKPKVSKSRSADKAHSTPVVLIRGLIHFACVAISIPFLALAAIFDGLYLAGYFVYKGIRFAFVKKPAGGEKEERYRRELGADGGRSYNTSEKLGTFPRYLIGDRMSAAPRRIAVVPLLPADGEDADHCFFSYMQQGRDGDYYYNSVEISEPTTRFKHVVGVGFLNTETRQLLLAEKDGWQLIKNNDNDSFYIGNIQTQEIYNPRTFVAPGVTTHLEEQSDVAALHSRLASQDGHGPRFKKLERKESAGDGDQPRRRVRRSREEHGRGVTGDNDQQQSRHDSGRPIRRGEPHNSKRSSKLTVNLSHSLADQDFSDPDERKNERPSLRPLSTSAFSSEVSDDDQDGLNDSGSTLNKRVVKKRKKKVSKSEHRKGGLELDSRTGRRQPAKAPLVIGDGSEQRPGYGVLSSALSSQQLGAPGGHGDLNEDDDLFGPPKLRSDHHQYNPVFTSSLGGSRPSTPVSIELNNEGEKVEEVDLLGDRVEVREEHNGENLDF